MSKRVKAAAESNAVDQQSEYATELKRVYNEIDMFSNLRWHERDADELYWKQGKRTSARIRQSSSTQAGNDLKLKKKDSSWQDDTNAQLGYGEITSVSASLLISLGLLSDFQQNELC